MLGILLFELRQCIGALLFYMAQVEIHVRLGILGDLRWRMLQGGEVSVKWPSGECEITPDHLLWDWGVDPNSHTIHSADPNDHYRPWLEANVGKQGRDWDWKIAPYKEGFYSPGDHVLIRVRKSKSHTLSAMALMWG